VSGANRVRRVAIPGCAGRMGRELIRAVIDSGLELSGASELSSSPAVGKDAGLVAGLSPLGVTVSDGEERLLEGAEGVIDFTTPELSAAICSRCADRRLPLVVGTTGLGDAGRERLARAAQRIPIVFAPNMSVGVNVLLRLVEQAARLLGSGYELEIIELHHGRKVDAPSGTALQLAQVLARATPEEGPLSERSCHGRHGAVGPRPRRQIGIHAVRGGDIVGEHTVIFCGEGERIELVHRASSRQAFARGAVRALAWASSRGPGLYEMQDVLGLR